MCRHQPQLPVSRLATGDTEVDELDPVAEMRLLAARVVDAHRQDPGNAGLAREARNTLLALNGLVPADEGPDLLAEILSVPGYSYPD
jgi:hypothetical protein